MTSATGAALTEAHRLQQLAIQRAALRDLVTLWPAFDATDIDASWAALEPAVLAITGQSRALSASLAGAYYQAMRLIEGVSGGFAVPTVTGWEQAAAIALRVMGPVAAKSYTARQLPDVEGRTLVGLSGAVGRTVLNGGRETLVAAVKDDRRARGWARTGSGSPCAFCAMLISRGPVYGEATGDFEAHDHCACGLEPVFSADEPRSPQAQELFDLWQTSTADAGNGEGDALRAFRAAVEGGA